MSDLPQASSPVWSRRPLAELGAELGAGFGGGLGAGLGSGGGAFAQDHRFARPGQAGIRLGMGKPDSSAGAAAEPVDPLAEAWQEGYAQGAADAHAAADAAGAAADAARHRIESALGRLDADAVTALEQRLRATVLALCEAVLADAALDPQTLARRVETAAAMFARAADERVIRLHPEDLALVHARLPEDWHCEPDSSLERGALRVESANGGVEDGPAQWRRALEEALGSC
ncbi:FliH/SctL family protein [Novosphingobium sp.]|uniref:FliH/SctL family protein n=1 Tax=Novosphingobium sp. TaxID=1874826 RepID=UPI0038BC0234